VFGKKGDPFTGTTWSAEGAGGMIDPVTGEAIGSAPMPTGTPGVPSLFSSWQKGEGLLKNLKPVGQKLKSANTGVNTLGTLYQSFLSSEEEKAAS
jgi:hypothetical protein